jgi:hypothetical protein
MLVMGSDSWRSLQDGLYRRFSTGASVIILEMGFSLGEMLFDASSLDKSQSRTPSVQDLGDLLFRTGCGNLHVSGEVERGSDLSLSIRNCVFCESEKAEEYKCNFVRGIALGLSTKLYKKEYKSYVVCSGDHQGHLCKITLTGR